MPSYCLARVLGPLVGALLAGVTEHHRLVAVQQLVGLRHVGHVACGVTKVCARPDLASTPIWAFMPKNQFLPFFDWCIPPVSE